MTAAASAGAPPRVRWPGLLLALAGSIAFSGKAVIVKLAYRHGVDPVTLIMYRMLFALPLFAALAWWAGRGQARLNRPEVLALLGLGFSGYYLASLLDFMGLALISASLERLILYLNPTLVLALSAIFLKRRVSGRELAALAVSYAGVVIVFGQELRLSGDNVAMGAALVFGSAVSYAIYLVLSGQWVRRIGAMRLTGWAGSVACLLCIGHFALFHPGDSAWQAARVAEPVVWLSVLNATACTVAPVLMVMLAIDRIGPTLTAQAGMVGPLSTIGMGVLLLSEPFTPTLIAGTVLVLSGVWLLARARA